MAKWISYCIPISPLFKISFPFRSSLSIEQSSLCYTVCVPNLILKFLLHIPVRFSCSVMSNYLWPHGLRPPGFPVHHQLPELAQTYVHRVSDAIQPSHPLSSPSPAASSLSRHFSLFQWVSSLHKVAKVLKLQFQHQSVQWTPRTDFL